MIFKKILISKIIIELIHNYKGEEENKKNKLKIIDKKNKEFIENNIEIFNNLNLNWNVDDILKKVRFNLY